MEKMSKTVGKSSQDVDLRLFGQPHPPRPIGKQELPPTRPETPPEIRRQREQARVAAALHQLPEYNGRNFNKHYNIKSENTNYSKRFFK